MSKLINKIYILTKSKYSHTYFITILNNERLRHFIIQIISQLPLRLVYLHNKLT